MDRYKAEPNVDSFPGPKGKKVVDRYNKTASKSTHHFPFVWDFAEEAIGPFCKDIDGNILLDFTGHGGAAPLGYNNPTINETLEELDDFDPAKMYGQCLYSYSQEHISPLDLMEKLTEVSSHHDMDMVFMSNSGAEAVENGIKICYDYTDGDYGVTFQNAFHGRTLGALSLNRSQAVHRSKFPNIHKITDVPYCQNVNCNSDTCGCGFFTSKGSILREKLENTMKPDEVSYIIVEPIQGEGGLNEPSDIFMKELSNLSKKYNIPLISDEVQSGIGRTGEFWAIDNYDVSPDVISAAKGLRVGATIAREEIFPDEKARVSSTWGGGDIIASIAGHKTIEIIEENNLMKNAKSKEKQIRKSLNDVDKISKIKGKGLMIGIEMETREQKENLINSCLQEGLLTLGCGEKTVRLLPPLDVNDREIKMACDIIKKVTSNL